MVARDGNPKLKRAEPPVVADHELLRQIGVGAYGEVWLARSVMGMPRAVKVLRRDQFEHERISGNLMLEPDARIELRLFGPGPGESDQLVVQGDFRAAGTLHTNQGSFLYADPIEPGQGQRLYRAIGR